MARPTLTDEQRRATRQKIRKAASELHAELGIANISARGVAERAGVSVGTLYTHFGNLTTLMQSLWRQPARKLVEELNAIAAAEPAAAPRLRQLLEAYVAFSSANEGVFRGAFLFVRPASAEPAERHVTLEGDGFFSVFNQCMVQGQAEGIFRAGDSETLTQLVLSAVHGALALPVNWQRLQLRDATTTAKLAIDAQMEWLQITD